jgi:hypothetical protein
MTAEARAVNAWKTELERGVRAVGC